jgi:hypothetical protein
MYILGYALWKSNFKKMAEEQKSFLERINVKIVVPVMAIITSISGYIAVIKDQEATLAQKELETELKQKEFKNSIKLMLFKEVKEAIQENNPKSKEVTLTFLEEFCNDEAELVRKFKSLMYDKASNQDIVSLASNYSEIDSTMKTSALELKTIDTNFYKIDVFYLEDIIAESVPRAKKIVEILEEKYPKFKIRLRILPREVNAMKGFRIGANQIRFEASEEKIATEIYNEINTKEIFPLERPVQKKISFQTPNYISVFVRNM